MTPPRPLLRPARRARATGAPRLLPVALAAMLAAGSSVAQVAPPATALPVANTGVAPRNATIAQTGGPAPVMTITQNAARGAIEWQSFDIGSAARVTIQQPSAQSVLVNRVTPTGNHTASQIHGALSANGRVFIVNTAGVAFSSTAQVNVGSLVASTLDLDPSMVANGYARLLDPATTTIPLVQGDFGSITVGSNAQIVAAPGGSVALVSSSSVAHNGIIDAVRGRIALAAGSAANVVLPATDSGFVDVVVTQQASGAGRLTLDFGSSTQAEGGSVVLGSGAGGVARADTIDIAGTVNVGSTAGAAGTVVVDAGAGGNVTLRGDAHIGAVSTAAGQRGGSVTVSGGTVDLQARGLALAAVPTTRRGTIDASGTAGGGSIALGGDATTSVAVQSGNDLYADALDTGDGGSIAARAMFLDPLSTRPVARESFGVTEVYGNLYARGGGNGGNGGRIETSGQALTTRLDVSGSLQSATIDASAAKGTAGTWSIDPFNVTISGTAPTSTGSDWTPVAPGAVVHAADIAKALDAGTSVEITTGSATVGAQAGDIVVEAGADITRSTGGAPVTLTLRAHRSIEMGAAAITAVAGAPLNVNFVSDSDGNGTGGIAVSGGRIATGGGNLVLSGGTDPASGFAAGTTGAGIFLEGADLSTTGAAAAGDIVLRGRGAGGSSQVGVDIVRSTVSGRNIEVLGRTAEGTGTRVSSSQFATDGGTVALRGTSTPGSLTNVQTIGLDLDNVTVSATDGNVVLAGLGDGSAGTSSPAPTLGLRFRALDIITSGELPGLIELAGEAVGRGTGIAFADAESSGLDIRAGTSTNIPSLSNVSIGAFSSDGLALELGLDTGNSQILTTGAVNFRPVAVDADGQVRGNEDVQLNVGPSGESSGGFYVDPQAFGGNLRADGGLVFGSSLHRGLIAVAPGALAGLSGQAVTLQNTGSGEGGPSAGIQLGAGVQVRDLALLSNGVVAQEGAFTIGNTLVAGGGGTFNLTAAGNTVGGNVGLADAGAVDLLVDGALKVGTGVALARFDGASAAFDTVQVATSTAGETAVLRSANGTVAVSHGIAMGEGGQLDLVSPVAITVDGESAALSGSQVQLWAPSITWDVAGRTNYYGCTYPTCTLSGVTPAETGLQALFPDRPVLQVVADPVAGTAGQPLPALTYTPTGFVNGDTAATLTGALATAATAQSPAGTYAIGQGTLASPNGYLISYTPGSLTLAAGPTPPPPPPPTPRDDVDLGREMTRAVFLDTFRSDVYGRNLDQPFICTAASVVGEGVARETGSDPLASEWGKVRNQPQLSGCLDVSRGGQCAAF